MSDTLICVLCCHNFHPDLLAAAQEEGWSDVQVMAYPVRCGRPAMRWEELEPLLLPGTSGVVILGRACLTGLDAPPDHWPMTRIDRQAECFHLVAGKTLVAEAISRGAYLITPTWLATWPDHLASMGFQSDQAGEFFHDFARELLLLDTAILPDADDRLREFGAAVRLPVRRLAVGLDYTRLLLQRAVNGLRWETERQRARQKELRQTRDMADLSAAMDFLGRLVLLKDEPEAIAAIEEMFRMLFAPTEFHFAGWVDGAWQSMDRIPPALQEQIRQLHREWAWTRSGEGFLLRLDRAGHTVGTIAIDHLAFPHFRERYLDTARSLLGICTLVIENARTLQRIKWTEAALRQATNTLLQESEIRFEATFEQAAVGIALVSPEGRWLRVNRKLCQIVGYDHDALLNLTFQEITHPEDLDTDLDYVQRMLARQIENYAMEKRYFRRDGSVVWINLTVSLVWKADTTPDYFIAVIEEIQARKEAEAALRESGENLREARRLAGLGDWKWDLRTDTHTWSEEIYRLYGRDPALPPASYPEVRSYFTPESWTSMAAAIEQSMATGKPYVCDAEVIPGDGGPHRWITTRGESLYDADGRILMLRGTVQDITERKHAEEEIRLLNAELEQRVQQRTAELEAVNQELKEFVYVASHDLQEPLRTMNSYAEFLREDVGEATLNESAQEDLRFITDAAKRMQTLVWDLLAYSRSGRLEVRHRPVALNDCLAAVQENLQTSMVESHASVTWEDLPTVRGEATSLISVFQNLIGNGIKFRRPGVDPILRVEAEANGALWVIRVRDNGIGMEGKYLEQIFQPFKRLHSKKEYPGTGLGLAIVRKIVERHGGVIQVESTPGHGSLFTLTLPAWIGQNQNPPDREAVP
ncbi:MAG: PAS domain S-box protein [Magnetococcales bacterium]|nr:PAS domain S-box protein [Magnetococcales bacterium]